VRRRVDVEADDVAQLGGKVRVIREFELAHAVRLAFDPGCMMTSRIETVLKPGMRDGVSPS
jgi:hypothetical protein